MTIKHIGRYHIAEILGKGGMGVVYKAVDPHLERIVAIKCLNDDLCDDELVIARFLREARSVAALAHPNCVRLYLADEQNGLPYLVMEYIDGETLYERLRKNGALGLEETELIVSDCARALKAADEKNIVHRDVKPGNIMIDQRRRAVMTDFGIAQIQYEMGAEGAVAITGTPGYMAPELISDGRSDRRGDIFSLGAVYYEMLTGERLINGADLPSCKMAISRPKFPDLSIISERFGDSVASRLQKMLDPDPSRRYSDYEALLEDLSHNKGAVQERDQDSFSPHARQQDALDTEEPATVLAGQSKVRAPVTRKMPLDAGVRRRRFRLVALGVISTVAMSIALALTSGIENPIGNFGNNELLDQQASEAEYSPSTGGEDEPNPMTAQNTERDSVGGSGKTTVGMDMQSLPHNSGAARASPDLKEPKISATALLRELRAERGDDKSAAKNSGPDRQTDIQLAAINRTGSSSNDLVAAPARNRSPAATSTTKSQTDRIHPDGISVVGVGDFTIAEPVVSLIKQRLHSAGLPVVEHRFIPDFDQYLLPDGLDLAGLVEPAINSGVRYVVMARAIASGSRELKFYGRRDIAYSVQLETLTYDLVQATQLGGTSTRQLEYTSLNANQKARSAAMPWVDPIIRQFEP